MNTEYKLFTEVMLSEAGKLLASRHKDNRTQLALLPERFE
jgi:hypothetical protein